ncbi:hypothetical protein J6590_026775 [Homalodisca vitripennis]|nr:hypothetical protein J6590_026775 [Homalodisca vitripennis]
MSKSDKSWICNECEIGKIPEKSPHKENSFLSKSSDQISELEDVKSKIQEHETLEEPDLETSLTLAAEAGNALLHENNRLRQDIQNIHKHKFILKANLASMEAKIEDILANEEKYINKIEVLQGKLQDTLLELIKNNKIDRGDQPNPARKTVCNSTDRGTQPTDTFTGNKFNRGNQPNPAGKTVRNSTDRVTQSTDNFTGNKFNSGNQPNPARETVCSDDEDFNIEVEADIHFPDPSSVLDKLISQLRTSSSARCSREKPSVTATKLDPSESIEEFFNKNIDCYRENQRQLTKSPDNNNKSTHFLDMGLKQKDKEKIHYKTRTFVNKKYIKPKTVKD